MISDEIKIRQQSAEKELILSNSFFVVTFKDGSTINEKDCDWTVMAAEIKVKYQEGTKTVVRCIFPVSKISMTHEGMYTEMEIPDGCEVYQAKRGQRTFLGNNSTDLKILGRVIGIIKEGEVVEERFLNNFENVVQGWRK